MTLGTDMGEHPAVALLANAVEDVRKAVSMLAADEIWTATNRDLILLLRSQNRLDSATAAAGCLLVREADVRGLGTEDGQVSTAAWLAKLLTLHPAEAKS